MLSVNLLFASAVVASLVVFSSARLNPHLDASKDCKVAFDLVVLQDISVGFGDIKKRVYKGLLNVFEAMDYQAKGSRYRMASFSDTPIPVFGCAEYGDRCFSVGTPWFKSSLNLKHYFNKLPMTWGVDVDSSTNIAMNAVANSGWYRNEKEGDKFIIKVLLVNTHRGIYHAAGADGNLENYRSRAKNGFDCFVKGQACCTNDFSNMSIIPNRNTAGGFVECGFDSEGKFTGTFEGPPSDDELYAKLAKEKINVIVMIPEVDPNDKSTTASKNREAFPKWENDYKKKMEAKDGTMHVSIWPKDFHGAYPKIITALGHLEKSLCDIHFPQH